MNIIDNGDYIQAVAGVGYKLFHAPTNAYYDTIIVGNLDQLEVYVEIEDPDAETETATTFSRLGKDLNQAVNDDPYVNSNSEISFESLAEELSKLINE